MKRVKTLVGGILATISSAITSIVALVYLFATSAYEAYYYNSGYEVVGLEAYYVVFAFLALASITALVLNILAISVWKSDAEKYKKYKGTIIAATVFNFALMSGMTIAAAILYIVDLVQEGKRVSTAQVAPVAPLSSTEAKLAAAEEFAQKLAKLDALKKNGILTEDEYSEIKKTYVKDYIGK